MGKTFRNAPSDFGNRKKTKSIDKKHQRAKVHDGAIVKCLEDDDWVVYRTAAQKKFLKRERAKSNRRINDFSEDD